MAGSPRTTAPLPMRPSVPATAPATVTLSSLNLSRATLAERYTLPTFRLRVASGPDAGRTARFARRAILVGSGDDCDFALADPSVSREHLSICGDRIGYRARDLASKNGTWFAGSRLVEAVLGPTAVFRLGQTELVYEQQGDLHEIALARDPELFGLHGDSDDMREAMARIAAFAADDQPVAVVGEPGTGKRLAAIAVHRASPRAARPAEVFDASTASADDLAVTLHADSGLWQRIAGGTLIVIALDELPPAAQPQAWRALRAHADSPAAPRLVATFERAPDALVKDGVLSGDWAAAFVDRVVTLPPLRRRPADIPLLVQVILGEIEQARADCPPLLLSWQTVQRLVAYPWPGNVRELRRHLERAAELATFGQAELTVATPVEAAAPATVVDPGAPYALARAAALQGFDRAYCAALLARTANDPARAAQLAGLSLVSLERLLKRTEASTAKS